MKKQVKEELKKKIEYLESEIKNGLNKLKNIYDEAYKNGEKIKNEIDEANEKYYKILEGFTFTDRINWKKQNADKTQKLNNFLSEKETERKINDIIKNIIDDYIYNLYEKYSYKIELLMIESIKNTRDFNDFQKNFDYEYNREKEKYIYNNICTLHKYNRVLNFNFKNTEVKPFNYKLSKIEIYSNLLKYDDTYTSTILNDDFINNEEAKTKEKEENQKKIDKINEKIDDFIINYYELKNYILNLKKIDKKYNDELKKIQNEKAESINENDIYNLKHLIIV